MQLAAPASAWQHGGASPELVNPVQVSQLAPNFHVPQAGEPAAVLFHLANASPDTVTITPSQVVTRELHEQDFTNGQFTLSGTVQSKKDGTWNISVVTAGFFAPISCGELTQAAPPGTQGGVLAAAKEKIKGKDEGKGSIEAELSDEFQKGTNKSDFVPCKGGKGCDDPIFEDDKGKKFKWVSCKEDACAKECKGAVCRLFYKGKQGKSTPPGKDSKGNPTPGGKDLPDPDNWMPVDSLKDKQKPNKDGKRVESNSNFGYACVCTCPPPPPEKK